MQGPNGPFFARLAAFLEAQGATVTKVNFNGGDYVFFPNAAHTFREPLSVWPAYCERLMTKDRIDWVLLFGDCRPVHQTAMEIAQRRGVRVGVFEEGYIRPNFVTFEPDGVNARSTIPRDPSFYRGQPPGPIPGAEIDDAFTHLVLYSIVYHCAGTALRPWFKHYVHHRTHSIREAVPWVRGALRKLQYRLAERGIEDELTQKWAGRYFLVPLQVHNDAQVTVHSDYGAVSTFIADVIRSFAKHAPEETRLVLKHHPLDRGYNDYAKVIAMEADRLGVRERVIYIHDQHLPSLLDNARGVVVINSTAGLQALDHGAPVKVCGRAAYDIEGLTFSGSLDSFWRGAESFAPDEALLASFKRYLVLNTQLGGSFYRTLRSGALVDDFGSEPSARVAPVVDMQTQLATAAE